jgi:dipeptidyl aminopeptidase/acylaminoacyl peptidase
VLFRAPGPLWSPGGDALLVPAAEPGSPGTGLWLVPLGGAPARPLAPGAEAAAWSPDGRFVVYRGWDAGGGRTLATVGRDGAPGWSLRLDGNPPPPFVVVEDAALFARGGALWRMPLGAAPGSAPTRLRELPGVRLESWLSETPPIAADRIGGLVAYACGTDLCLAGVDGGAPTRVALGEPPPALTLTPVPARPTPVGPPPAPAAKAIPDFDPTAAGWPVLRAAWSPDGRRLAAVWSDRQPSELGRRPRLAIIDRSGGVLAQLDVGPNGPVDAPFWTPDGRFLLLRAYPENGRRVVVVEVATGRVFDLSQPGWDALFSPSPDGTRLLLANGRGGFWVAPVERRQP